MKPLLKFLVASGIASIIICIAFIIAFAIMGLIFWGIGSFIVWAFSIPYNWTYLHGIATALIICVVKKIFKRETHTHSSID